MICPVFDFFQAPQAALFLLNNANLTVHALKV